MEAVNQPKEAEATEAGRQENSYFIIWASERNLKLIQCKEKI